MIETDLTITFKRLEGILLKKAIFWNPAGQPVIIFLNMKILQKSNSLQDWVLDEAICLKENSSKLFTIYHIKFSVVILTMNWVLFTFFIVQCTIIKDIPSWILSKTLIVDCYMWLKQYLIKRYMKIVLWMHTLTDRFLMQELEIFYPWCGRAF